MWDFIIGINPGFTLRFSGKKVLRTGVGGGCFDCFKKTILRPKGKYNLSLFDENEHSMELKEGAAHFQ